MDFFLTQICLGFVNQKGLGGIHHGFVTQKGADGICHSKRGRWDLSLKKDQMGFHHLSFKNLKETGGFVTQKGLGLS